jgi:hypothetical protein
LKELSHLENDNNIQDWPTLAIFSPVRIKRAEDISFKGVETLILFDDGTTLWNFDSISN